MLDDREAQAIRHALGVTRRGGRGATGRRWAYRNYYAAGESDAPMWRGLVARGLAVTLRAVDPASCPYPGFAVTAAGVEAAGLSAYVPALLAPRTERS